MTQSYLTNEFFYPAEQLVINDLFNPFQSCKARARVYANACIYVLLHIGDDKHSQILEIQNCTQKFVNHLDWAEDKFKEISYKLGKYTLLQELQVLLNEFLVISELHLKDILLGEAFWQWQVNEPVLVVSKSIHQEIVLVEQDTPMIYPLSKSQLNSWEQIVSPQKPIWFKNLPFWAQFALVQIYEHDPKRLSRIMPITFRGLPGLANTTHHQFKIDLGLNSIQFDAYRMAVPVPYLMRDYYERSTETQGNIQQLLEHWLTTYHISNHLQQYWGYESNSLLMTNLKKPISFISLLTGSNQANWLGKCLDILGWSLNNNNALLVADSNLAYQRFFEKQPKTSSLVEIFIDELALNMFRKSVTVFSISRWVIFLNHFINMLEQYQNDIPVKNHYKINMLTAIKQTFEDHVAIIGAPLTPGRNRNLFLAAICDLAIRLTGGISIGNCKSSKDRKGLELLYADAMLVFYQLYGSFPKYNDQGQVRENFLLICKTLFDSGHILKVINQNMIGCPGLKDENITDLDLRSLLGENYETAKMIANLSEPCTFLEKYRFLILKTLVILASIETALVGVAWLAQWLQPINLPFVIAGSPVITSMLALIILNMIACSVTMLLIDYINFRQKGDSLDVIILSSENNVQYHDKYQKPACIS